jgi:hypothetical protein
MDDEKITGTAGNATVGEGASSEAERLARLTADNDALEQAQAAGSAKAEASDDAKFMSSIADSLKDIVFKSNADQRRNRALSLAVECAEDGEDPAITVERATIFEGYLTGAAPAAA